MFLSSQPAGPRADSHLKSFSMLLALPIQLVLTCTFYISVYFSFVDCFGEP